MSVNKIMIHSRKMCKIKGQGVREESSNSFIKMHKTKVRQIKIIMMYTCLYIIVLITCNLVVMNEVDILINFWQMYK